MDELLRNRVRSCRAIQRVDRSWFWNTREAVCGSPTLWWPTESWFQYHRKRQDRSVCLLGIRRCDRSHRRVERPLVAALDALDTTCFCLQYRASQFTGTRSYQISNVLQSQFNSPLSASFVQLFIGVFDFDAADPNHDIVGRATCNITNFHPNTIYTVKYRLHSVINFQKVVRGSITLRIRVELFNPRKTLLSGYSLNREPEFISVSKKSEFRTVSFTLTEEVGSMIPCFRQILHDLTYFVLVMATTA